MSVPDDGEIVWPKHVAGWNKVSVLRFVWIGTVVVAVAKIRLCTTAVHIYDLKFVCAPLRSIFTTSNACAPVARGFRVCVCVCVCV